MKNKITIRWGAYPGDKHVGANYKETGLDVELIEDLLDGRLRVLYVNTIDKATTEFICTKEDVMDWSDVVLKSN